MELVRMLRLCSENRSKQSKKEKRRRTKKEQRKNQRKERMKNEKFWEELIAYFP
jgi:hypothetical protein